MLARTWTWRQWTLTHTDQGFLLIDATSRHEFDDDRLDDVRVEHHWSGWRLVVARPALQCGGLSAAMAEEIGRSLAEARAAVRRRRQEAIANRAEETYQLIATERQRAIEAEHAESARLAAEAERQSAAEAALTERVDALLADQHFPTLHDAILTRSQAEAVVRDDRFVLLTGTAGTGKTTALAARALQALICGSASDRILMLTTDQRSAADLQCRVDLLADQLGVAPGRLRATTFEGLAAELVTEAEGKAPTIPEWTRPGADIIRMRQLLDALRTTDRDFATSWDRYRLVHANTSASVDAYDRSTGTFGLRTLRGDVVLDLADRQLADLLHLHGVEYRYVPSDDQPRFHYPQIDLWHAHREHGTTNGGGILETTWADMADADMWEQLCADLTARGLVISPVPVVITEPLATRDGEVLAVIRQFLRHVNSNGLRRGDIERRLLVRRPDLKSYRTRLFLSLAWRIDDAWQAALAAENATDTETLLRHATQLVTDGTSDFEVEEILIDDLQDASSAALKLLSALTTRTGAKVLAAGDALQSIGRSIGAEDGAIADFASIFGGTALVQLSVGFRCAQPVADAAAVFTPGNSHPEAKRSRAAMPVKVVSAPSEFSLGTTLEKVLDDLALQTGHGQISVTVIGMSERDRDHFPRRTWPQLDLGFRTARDTHGLESDVVIVCALTAGRDGSIRAVDPLLPLAAADPDQPIESDARRVCHVALTRARDGLIVLTVEGFESPFVKELTDAGVTRDGLVAKARPSLRVPTAGAMLVA